MKEAEVATLKSIEEAAKLSVHKLKRLKEFEVIAQVIRANYSNVNMRNK